MDVVIPMVRTKLEFTCPKIRLRKKMEKSGCETDVIHRTIEGRHRPSNIVHIGEALSRQLGNRRSLSVLQPDAATQKPIAPSLRRAPEEAFCRPFQDKMR